MADSKREEENKFDVILDPGPPVIAFIKIPFGTYLDDNENGMALLHGKIKEGEAILSKHFLREKQKQMAMKPGVILPNGQPLVA